MGVISVSITVDDLKDIDEKVKKSNYKDRSKYMVSQSLKDDLKVDAEIMLKWKEIADKEGKTMSAFLLDAIIGHSVELERPKVT